MNLGEVRRVLDESFQKKTEEGIIRNIIFWYDEEGEFKDDLQGLNLYNPNDLPHSLGGHVPSLPE